MDWSFFTRFVVYSSLIWLAAISSVNEWKWQGTGNSYVLYVFFFSFCAVATAGAAHFFAVLGRGGKAARRVEWCLPVILASMVLMQHNAPEVMALVVFAVTALALGAAKFARWHDLDAKNIVFLATVFTAIGISLYCDNVLSALTKASLARDTVLFPLIGLVLAALFIFLLLRAPERREAPVGRMATLGKYLYFVLVSFLLLNIARGDAFHCGAYAGPANAVFQGKVPVLEVNAQYGLNYLIFSTAFLPADAAKLETIWLVVGLLNSVMIFFFGLLLDKIIKNQRALYLLFTTAALAYFASNTFQINGGIFFPINTVLTPSTGAMRFFPSLLLALAIMEIKPGKYLSMAALLAFGLNFVWSAETSIWAAAMVGAWIAARCFYDSGASLRAALWGGVAYLAASQATLGGLFLVYGIPWSIHNIFAGYVIFLTYMTGETAWHKFMDSTDLVWVGAGLLYFLATCLVMYVILFARKNRHPQKDQIITLLLPVTLLGLAQSTYYVGNPLKGCLAAGLMPALAIILFFAAQRRLEGGGLPKEIHVFSTIILYFFILFSFFHASFLLTQNTATVAYRLATSGPRGTMAAAQNLYHASLDDVIDKTPPPYFYPPARLRELVSLLNAREPSRYANVFSPEATMALMWSHKANALPIGNRDNDELSDKIESNILAAADTLPKGTRLFVAKDLSSLGPLDHSLLYRLSDKYSLQKVQKGEFIDIYQLADPSTPNDLVLPYRAHGIPAGLQDTLSFNPALNYAPMPQRVPFEQDLEYILDTPGVLHEIHLFGRPNFPEYNPTFTKIVLVTAANERIELASSDYTLEQAMNATSRTVENILRFTYPAPVKAVILAAKAPRIDNQNLYNFIIGQVEIY
jgi:hypothetical protein